MKKYLTKTERATILRELTKEQKKTLFIVVGRRYRSYFSNLLAKYKGTRDWAFYKYVDHGSVQKNIKCECGKCLRHQFVLVNRKTKEKRNIGSTHFIEELQIPENIAKDVLRGIHDINFDLDELLQKYDKGWALPKYLKENINKIILPKDIEEMLRMGLPLLSRQINLLYSKIYKIKTRGEKSENKYNINIGEFNYELKHKEIYKVLVGEIDFFSYIDFYKEEIYTFLRQKRKYVPIFDLINHLVGKGLPNELLYGQHALTKHFIMYLSKREDLSLWAKPDGYIYIKVLDK
ncbi:hypothetical protein ABE096_01575 [Robertmurraya massiliosenegalensis]|uniref:hypothetical protein n=1 Tax=Robertmurraya TaxID=2837507 RepID=UPI0039A51FFD